MAELLPFQRMPELAVIGEGTREQIVPAYQIPAMHRACITFCGFSDVVSSYRFSRRCPDFSQFLVTVSGAGMVLVEGCWERLERGMAYATPALKPHAYHALPDTPWQFCWINYVDQADKPPAIPVTQPTVLRVSESTLHAAMIGLYHEHTGGGDADLLDRWGELLHENVLRAARPRPVVDPLWHVWERVNANLQHPWTVSELAGLAGISEEYLRQMSHRYHRRSPLKQTTFLRMKRAAVLLNGTDQKLEVIARALGYENPFTFSRAFKRWTGVAPDHFRQGGRSAGVGEAEAE